MKRMKATPTEKRRGYVIVVGTMTQNGRMVPVVSDVYTSLKAAQQDLRVWYDKGEGATICALAPVDKVKR